MNVVAPGCVATGSTRDFEAVAAGVVLVADGDHALPETWPRP